MLHFFPTLNLYICWWYELQKICSHLQAGDVPVEFEEFHVSEVQNMASEEKLEQVLTSMKNNKVAMKGSYIFVSSDIVHLTTKYKLFECSNKVLYVLSRTKQT